MKNITLITSILILLFSFSTSFGQKVQKVAAPLYFVDEVNLECSVNSFSVKRQCNNPNQIILNSSAGTSVFQNEGLKIFDSNNNLVSHIKGIKSSPFTSKCLNLIAGQTYTIHVVNSFGNTYNKPHTQQPYIFNLVAKDCGIQIQNMGPAKKTDRIQLQMACEPPCPINKTCINGQCQ